jgi:hypothetical protein
MRRIGLLGYFRRKMVRVMLREVEQHDAEWRLSHCTFVGLVSKILRHSLYPTLSTCSDDSAC